jgi:hypothetical protein
LSAGLRSSPLQRAARALRPGDWLPLAASAALPCLPFLPLLLGGDSLWFRDFSLYFVPMKTLLVDLWREGQVPLWDPYLRNGLPFLANPQAGVFYPPSLVLVAFGVEPGLTLFILLHLAAAGAGFHLFLREARLPPLAALLGSIGFALGGYVASLINVLNNLQAAVWIPWILLFALRACRRPGLSSWVGLVVSIALALLGGELELAALGVGLGLASALALGPADATAAGPLRLRLRGAGLVAAAAAAATALVAVQLLPTAELLRESVRRGGLSFDLAAADSFAPASLFSLAFPRPALPGTAGGGADATVEMPWLLSAYGGIAVVCLAVLGVSGPRRRWTLFWCTAALVGVLLALGGHSVVFRIAYELVPPFRSLRYPEKFLLLPALALPALAAAGLERVLSGGVSRSGIAAGAAVIVLCGAGSLLWMVDPARPDPARAAAAGGVALAAAAGVLLLARSRRLGRRPASVSLCVLAALDLGIAARAVNPSVPWRFYESSWAARVLEREGGDRTTFRIRSSPLSADMEQVAVVREARLFSNHYFFQESLAPNLGQLYGYLEQDGMAGIETQGAADLIDALVARDPRAGLRLLRLMGVQYVVTSFPLPAEDVVTVALHDDLPVAVVRLRGPLARAYLASGWEVVADSRAALERALAEDFPAGEKVVLDRAPPEFAGGATPARGARRVSRTDESPRSRSGGGPAEGGAGVVHRALWEPAAARFEVELARAGLLVVTDSYYPGWDARLDGRPAPLLRANGYQRAVAVPAGRHSVELRYRPASFTAGAAVSLVSVLLFAGLIARPPGRRACRGGSRPGPSGEREGGVRGAGGRLAGLGGERDGWRQDGREIGREGEPDSERGVSAPAKSGG